MKENTYHTVNSLNSEDKALLGKAIASITTFLSEGSMEDQIKNLKGNVNYEYIVHIVLHRQAFHELESKTKYAGVFSPVHDVDKIGLTFALPKHEAKRLHRLIARHHNFSWDHVERMVYVEKMFDWECCHLTKVDEKMTAWEYLLSKEYPADKFSYSEEILKELGFVGHRNPSPLTDEGYRELAGTVKPEDILEDLRLSIRVLEDALNASE